MSAVRADSIPSVHHGWRGSGWKGDRMAGVLLVLKLVLVPALVGSVSLAGRRWGPRVAGLLTSFPIVTGPALLFFAIEQGAAFAAEAARGALAALVAVAAAGLAYAWSALRAPWWASLVASWAAFTALTLLVHAWRPGAAAALLVSCASFAAAPGLLPAASWPAAAGTARTASRRAWDLPLRMLSAMALVLTVTELADRLGPALSGAFTPFPVALTVLLAFTHARDGAASAIRFLRGFLAGMWSFAAFCFVAALAMVPLGRWAGLLLACAVVLPVQGAALWLSRRSRAIAAARSNA